MFTQFHDFWSQIDTMILVAEKGVVLRCEFFHSDSKNELETVAGQKFAF